MADQFTFKKPDEGKYLQVLISFLKSKGHPNLAKILSVSKCQIWTTESYSYLRQGAKISNIHFIVPFERLSLTNGYLQPQFKFDILEYCNLIMPKDVGYDVMDFSFTSKIDTSEEKSLEDELKEVQVELEEAHSSISLPQDILIKGKEMSEAYLYLYAVENYMRLFVEGILKKEFGDSYEVKINIPQKIQDSIKGKKTKEAQNKWLSMRGSSFLFYLDFIELKSIIDNNWDQFKNLFPDQQWINGKLDELYDCRNLIAHNSYIGEHERNVIKVNFRSIVKQLK